MGFSRRSGLRFNRGRLAAAGDAVASSGSPPDTTDPVLVSAVVPVGAPNTIVWTYDEPLDEGSVPLTAACSATMSTGITRTVSSLAIVGAVVTWTMSGAINAGAVVTGTYTAGASPVRDLAHNNAANLVAQAVTNNSTADADLPGVSSIASDTLGTYIDITFDESMDQTSTPAAARFSLSLTAIAVGTPAWQSATVLRVPIVGRLLQSESTTISYTAAANPIQDLATNALPNLVASAVTNNSTVELETVLESYRSDWTLADTEYVVGRPISFIPQAGGGGGDGGPVQDGSGGAGEVRFGTVASALPGGYSGVVGAAGAAGSSGTATAGGDSTVSDTSGVIYRAKGGSPGVGGATATAGAGGTGGSGGTGRNGGDGTTGTAANIAGGASSGTSTAAVGSTPGQPEGMVARSGAQATPGRGVGGSCSNAHVGYPGGLGLHTVTYQRAVVASSRPRVSDIAYGRTVGAQVSSINVTVPGTHAANDRLMTTVAQEDNSGIGTMSGWTGIVDQGTAATGLVFVRDSTGGDPVNVAFSTTKRANWITRRLKGAAAVTNITAGAATMTTVQANPPSHNHGSSVDALWFAGCALNQANTHFDVTAYPTGYEARFMVPFEGGSSSASQALCTCSKFVAAQSTEDPGAFTTSNTISGAAWTVCVPKA